MHGHNRLDVARQDVNNPSEVEKKACFVLRLFPPVLDSDLNTSASVANTTTLKA